MDNDQKIWWVWIDSLSRWGLQELVASVLDVAGPLTIVGAQMVYLFQPLLSLALSEESLQAAARMLEEPGHTRAFVSRLRKASI